MKIVIRQLLGKSGVDVWAENLCRGIQSQGYICNLDLRSGIFQFFPSLTRLKKTKQDFDIIHSNTWNAYAFREKCPLVVTEHHVVHDPALSSYKTIPQKVYHHWIYECERKSLKVADAVTCVSQYTREKLEEHFGYNESKVIYNGIDTSFFKPFTETTDISIIPPDKTIVFFAGNISKRKGGDLLPDIMKRLGDQFLLILAIGQRQPFHKTQKNIMNLGHLHLKDLVEAYNRCDIFLSPTRLEGFGLSVAEAMACGKPVVATNCSSLPELVVDGNGGFLCRMNDVKDFVEKIRYLASEDDLRKKMGEYNRKRVEEKFELSRMVDEYIQLYKSL